MHKLQKDWAVIAFPYTGMSETQTKIHQTYASFLRQFL